GSVVPGFTRTCAPAANWAGVWDLFSCVVRLAFFPLMAAPPLSLPGFLHKNGPARQAWRWDSLRDEQGYNDSMTILFLHGWQSVPGGVKPTFLAQHGHEVINPQLPDEEFTKAVRIAQAEFDKHQPAVVVGSSRGGAVAMNIHNGTARLILLCG